jgi:hypothetical protein
MWVDPFGSDPKWVRWWLADIIDQKMLPYLEEREIEITKADRGTQLKLFYDFFSRELRLSTVYAGHNFFQVKLDDKTVTWYTLKYG